MTELKENSVFHEKIDKGYLYTNVIDIYIGLDVSDISTQFEELSLFTHILNNHCNNLECTYFDEMRNINDRINKLRSLSSHLNIITHSRSKRGFINAIGSLSKSLFGTLDEDDLTTINANLDKLFDANNKLKTIVSNQTALIRKVLDSDNLQRINQLTLDARANSNRITKIALMNSWIIRTEGAISDLHFSYDELLNTITLAKQGIISPQIIERDEFMEAYQRTLKNDATHLALKAERENFQILLDIADLKLFITNDKLFFKISIPILPALQWDIDHVYPIPTKKNNVFMIPFAEHQIYFISGLNYINVDKEYLDNHCKTKIGITMCKQT